MGKKSRDFLVLDLESRNGYVSHVWFHLSCALQTRTTSRLYCQYQVPLVSLSCLILNNQERIEVPHILYYPSLFYETSLGALEVPLHAIECATFSVLKSKRVRKLCPSQIGRLEV